MPGRRPVGSTMFATTSDPSAPLLGAPVTNSTEDTDSSLQMDWQLTEEERDGLMASGLDPQTRLQRAVHIVERAWFGEAPEGHALVQVEAILTIDEHERTWPDARTSLVDPWYGHGDVDRANATARQWSARFLLRALGFDAHSEGPTPSVSTPPSPQSAEAVASSTSRSPPTLMPKGAFTDLDIRALASLFALLDRWDRQPAANDDIEIDPE